MGRSKDAFTASYDASIGGLANYISYTPWINPETGQPHKNDKGETLMLQYYLEKKYNLPEDYLTNRPVWRNPKKGEETYFQTKTWKLNDGSTVFDLGLMEDELGYYVALANQRIANSEKEWKAHKWPRAEYYVAVENESDTIKYQKNETKGKAIANLYSNELTDAYKRKFVSILDITSSKSILTKEQVDNLLFDYIEQSTYLTGSNIDKFNDLFRLLSTPSGRAEIEARYILRQAIDCRIVYEKQGSYTWVRSNGNLIIGDRYQEAIDFILSPKKDKEVSELRDEIKLKL